MKIVYTCLIFCLFLLGLSLPGRGQEVLPAPTRPLAPGGPALPDIQWVDMRFQVDNTFAGIVENGNEFTKTWAFFDYALASWLDSATQSPAQDSRSAALMTVRINRLGILEDNYTTQKNATLYAEFDFLQPRPTAEPQLLHRQTIRLSYQDKNIREIHTQKITEAFFSAWNAFSHLDTTPLPQTPGSHLLAQQAFSKLENKSLKEGIYTRFESFLLDSPDQTLEFEAKGSRNLVLFTEEGKKRPVKNTDPVWGAYYEGQLYIFDWGVFFPTYFQGNQVRFHGINTKSQAVVIGTTSGVLATQNIPAEHKKAFILDWQTGGYYQDPASIPIKARFISLKADPLVIVDRKFDIVEVIDARYQADSTFVGVGQKGMYNTKIALSFEKSLATSIAGYLNQQFPPQEGYIPVILRITRMGVWEQTFPTAERAYISAEMEFLAKVNDEYIRLHRETIFEEIGGMDVTGAHAHQIGSALVQAIQNYAESVEGPGNISEENIVTDIYAKEVPPIMQTKERKPGIYATFDEFRNNVPSQPAVFVDKGGQRRLLITTAKGKTRTIRPNDMIWGVYDGQQLFIYQSGVFFPVYQQGDGLRFDGYDVASAYSKTATAGLAFGLIGAAIAGAGSSKERTFIIDWQTGSFYPLP